MGAKLCKDKKNYKYYDRKIKVNGVYANVHNKTVCS